MSVLYNLARVSTATTGTGTITLGGAVSGYLTFALAGVANGDVVSYAIKDGANSEIGTGTYTSAGTTLTRTVTKSTNANAAINLSGTAEVFITPRAEDLGSPGQRPGTATNDDAAAGNVGEYLQSTLAYASKLTLATGVGQNIASLSLTAGDWDVWGTIYFEANGTAAGIYNQGSISTTSATLSSVDGEYAYAPVCSASFQNDGSGTVGPVRKSLSGTTTIYFVTQAAFTGSALKSWGQIRARRVR